jgi:hypothetical protein
MDLGFYAYSNDYGHWTIVRLPADGRWHAMLDGESLGSFHCPKAAAESLSIGFIWLPASGLDPAECDLPAALQDWNFIPTD